MLVDLMALRGDLGAPISDLLRGLRAPVSSASVAALPHGAVVHRVSDWIEQLEVPAAVATGDGGFGSAPPADPNPVLSRSPSVGGASTTAAAVHTLRNVARATPPPSSQPARRNGGTAGIVFSPASSQRMLKAATHGARTPGSSARRFGGGGGASRPESVADDGLANTELSQCSRTPSEAGYGGGSYHASEVAAGGGSTGGGSDAAAAPRSGYSTTAGETSELSSAEEPRKVRFDPIADVVVYTVNDESFIAVRWSRHWFGWVCLAGANLLQIGWLGQGYLILKKTNKPRSVVYTWVLLVAAIITI